MCIFSIVSLWKSGLMDWNNDFTWLDAWERWKKIMVQPCITWKRIVSCGSHVKIIFSLHSMAKLPSLTRTKQIAKPTSPPPPLLKVSSLSHYHMAGIVSQLSLSNPFPSLNYDGSVVPTLIERERKKALNYMKILSSNLEMKGWMDG